MLACLNAGANDLGGTLMNETITRAAGASHGQERSPRQMEDWITALGRTPQQRTTLYGDVPVERQRISFDATPVSEINLQSITNQHANLAVDSA